uniref:Uncharacterized protein n=1 Tax=Anguilla anguilla TaxID=7936 RepID=A0A0E9QZH9_ANGAN
MDSKSHAGALAARLTAQAKIPRIPLRGLGNDLQCTLPLCSSLNRCCSLCCSSRSMSV